MSFSKVFLLAGAAAFVSSAALAGGHNGKIPFRASAVLGHNAKSSKVSVQAPKGEPGTAKCGTGFGNPPSTPDGIVAWNDTSGTFDTGGAADFTCTGNTKIKKVWVNGYFGTTQEQFNVIFYKNSSKDGSDEANDKKVVCSYTGLLGNAGGQYPQDVTTKLTLSSPCKLKAGKYWVHVQNNDSAGPWYWEVQDSQGGTTNADWDDAADVYGSGCTTFNNDRYLVDCLGYPYPDFMLELH